MTFAIGPQASGAGETGPELRVSVRVDEPKLLGHESDGTAEYSICPRVELEYRSADWPADAPRPFVTVPVALVGDRVSLTDEGYRDLKITDADGTALPCFAPEHSETNAKLELRLHLRMSCLLADGFGVTFRHSGEYKLQLTIVLRDQGGRSVEGRGVTTFRVDLPPKAQGAASR